MVEFQMIFVPPRGDGMEVFMKLKKKKKILLVILVIIVVLYFALYNYIGEIVYYSQRGNYVVATGTVDFINYTGDQLIIGFSDMSENFEDDCFAIAGANMDVVLRNGIKNKLTMGDTITFVAAPKVFGDGYVIPIVSITIEGQTILEFEEGYQNLLKLKYLNG